MRHLALEMERAPAVAKRVRKLAVAAAVCAGVQGAVLIILAAHIFLDHITVWEPAASVQVRFATCIQPCARSPVTCQENCFDIAKQKPL